MDKANCGMVHLQICPYSNRGRLLTADTHIYKCYVMVVIVIIIFPMRNA